MEQYYCHDITEILLKVMLSAITPQYMIEIIQLVNFITCGCESSSPFFVIYKAGRNSLSHPGPRMYWRYVPDIMDLFQNFYYLKKNIFSKGYLFCAIISFCSFLQYRSLKMCRLFALLLNILRARVAQWVTPSFVNYKKGWTRLAAASNKVY
jgi:hypothetical protein